MAVAPAFAVAVVAGCAPTAGPSKVPVKAGGGLVTDVPFSLNDAGRASSVALDEDGNPNVVYLLLKPVLKKGEIPPLVVAGQPQPPAVMLSIKTQGIWNNVSVTQQETAPAQGVAPEIANDEGEAIPGVDTGLAIDGQGHQHIVWSTPTGLFYATGASGGFSPKRIVRGATSGGAVAVDSSNTPWVSYYQGSSVQVAHQSGGQWQTEAIMQVSPGGLLPARTAIEVGADDEPLVAFNDPGTKTPMLARGADGGWTTEKIEPGGGGWGISLALDKDRNPHVAYYTNANQVHHAHSIGGSQWEVSLVGKFATGRIQDVSGWSTGIGVDDQGVHYVTWADTAGKTVRLATNRGGKFSQEPVPGGAGGLGPSLAVSPDGKDLALAWFDAVNTNLNVATTPSGGLGLAYSPKPQPSGPSAPPTGQPPACRPSGTKLQIDAPNGAAGSGFDKDCLAAPAGTALTIDFTNNDTQIHNVAIYTADPLANPDAKLLGGAPSPSDVVAPGDSTTYEVSPLDAGVYYFHCDIHPTTMQGQFVVAK
jgi:plastocyanin